MDDLAAPYSLAQQRRERAAVALFFLAQAALAVHLVVAFPGPWALLAVPPALFLAWVAADLASGLVHWACDTWGTVHTPGLGENFLRPFRHHHVDPRAMTRHGWVSTCGNSALVTLVVLAPAAAVPWSFLPPWAWPPGAWIFAFTQAVFWTNLFHRWAHQPRVPALVRLAQRLHLVLPPDHHARHHQAPHLVHYGITCGWTNPVADRIGFYRALEHMISALTGLSPRADQD
jgi:ubiquitin-conjugating enzyme E2 variant